MASKAGAKAATKGVQAVKSVASAGGGRKLNRLIRVTVPAQAATMQGLGAQLGQHGFKVIDFCQQFNKQTAHIAKDTRMPCMIRLYKDRTFEFAIKPPMTSHLVRSSLCCVFILFVLFVFCVVASVVSCFFVLLF